MKRYKAGRRIVSHAAKL